MRYLHVSILLLCGFYSLTSYAATVVVESGTIPTVNHIYGLSNLHSLANRKEFGLLMQNVALQMLGKPYSSFLLDQKTPEYLLVSTEHTDCMLFVEHVWAISMMIYTNTNSMINLESYIRQIRYHGVPSYCNRNHYFKDWALSNQNKDILVDESSKLGNDKLPRRVYFMSNKLGQESDLHHEDIECIRNREEVINKEQLGFIPIDKLPEFIKQIRSGDIIGIVLAIPGIDVAHMGVAYVNDAQVGIIHASSKEHKVILTKNLLIYLKQFKKIQGVVILRPNGSIDAKSI